MTLIRSCCNYAASRKTNVHPVQKLKFVCPDPVAWAPGSRTHVMCGLTSRQLIFEALHWNKLWHVNDRYIGGKCCFAEKFSWVQGTFLVVAVHFFFFLSLWRVCVSIFMKCFEAVDFVLGQKVLKAYTSSPLSSCFPVCILSSCKLFFKKMPAKFVLAWRCCWQLHTDHRRSISGVFCGEKDILPMPPSHCRACNSFGSGLSNFSKDRIRNN